ncbi:MAG: MFS transporter, partial [Actinomycetes bacterium]|nr:MFS transporter [Actinomycetes bacterium]MDX5380939.1 MFS transporter [Actinomycetes bacterium]MDX5400051.1 MFS transporter [Actinomycetes bacterium]MDX5450701.1 MFS transporter [Actinomycetes bacterium]
TTALIVLSAAGTATLAVIGLVQSFAVALGLIVVWGLLEAAAAPVRRAYLNGLIPSQQRATVLSFDSLVGSAGGAWSQPVLGRTADLWGYGASFVAGAGLAALALPFIALSRRQRAAADESAAA